MALAAWANIEQDRQTSTGYERTYKANNRVLHEVWDQSSMHGEFSVITANRFMVKIEGDVPNMDALKAAAGGDRPRGARPAGRGAGQRALNAHRLCAIVRMEPPRV